MPGDLVLIYKDEICSVSIDFYKRPAILELNHSEVITHIDINGKFIDRSKKDAQALAKWVEKVDDNELSDIIWEWQNGNDDFDLISTKLYV